MADVSTAKENTLSYFLASAKQHEKDYIELDNSHMTS